MDFGIQSLMRMRYCMTFSGGGKRELLPVFGLADKSVQVLEVGTINIIEYCIHLNQAHV
jgi:hypothetical protein